MCVVYKPDLELDYCDLEWDFQDFISDFVKGYNIESHYIHIYNGIRTLYKENPFDVTDKHDIQKVCAINAQTTQIIIEMSDGTHIFESLESKFIKYNCIQKTRYNNIINNIGFWKAFKLGLQHMDAYELYSYLSKTNENILLKFIKDC